MGTRSFSVFAPKLQTAFLKYELNPDFNREEGVLLADEKVEIGQPLGLGAGDPPEADPVAGNTGGGAITLADPPLGVGVVPGIYRLICFAEDENGGEFHVFDPAGTNIGVATVGDAFEGPVNFTIADGAPDFAVGDAFEVLVHPGTKYAAWDPEAVDGRQVFAGFPLMPGTTPEGSDGKVLVLARGPAIVASDGLELPEGISAEHRAALIAAMEAKGIVLRMS